mmetsp:Transcript_12448/g.41498  ORF Transcript_12448/g.41498 Transcript_12448/m.41498 type:complete len:226 (-) Transcript_12448:2027-2704(-)
MARRRRFGGARGGGTAARACAARGCGARRPRGFCKLVGRPANGQRQRDDDASRRVAVLPGRARRARIRPGSRSRRPFAPFHLRRRPAAADRFGGRLKSAAAAGGAGRGSVAITAEAQKEPPKGRDRSMGRQVRPRRVCAPAQRRADEPRRFAGAEELGPFCLPTQSPSRPGAARLLESRLLDRRQLVGRNGVEGQRRRFAVEKRRRRQVGGQEAQRLGWQLRTYG